MARSRKARSQKTRWKKAWLLVIPLALLLYVGYRGAVSLFGPHVVLLSAPPQLNLEGADPAVIKLLESTRAQVLKEIGRAHV